MLCLFIGVSSGFGENIWYVLLEGEFPVLGSEDVGMMSISLSLGDGGGEYYCS